MEQLHDLEVKYLRDSDNKENVDQMIRFGKSIAINGVNFCDAFRDEYKIFQSEIDRCMEMEDPDEAANCVMFTRAKHKEYAGINNVYKKACLNED